MISSVVRPLVAFPTASRSQSAVLVGVLLLVAGFSGTITCTSAPSAISTLSGNTIVLGMSAAQGSSPGDHQATLRVFSGGTEIAHAVVYTFIK